LSELRILPGPSELSHAAAEEFLRLGSASIAANGRFAVALAGGTTPRPAYEHIAATWKSAPGGPLDWNRVYLFWGDERRVPPDDPQSNFGMAREALIRHVPIPQENVHPMPAMFPELPEAAKMYEERLRSILAPPADQPPRFDLVLLGMGPDGHVASLFPGSAALDVKDRWVVENWVQKVETWRLTMTFPVLNQAANVIVLVSGREKSRALRRVVEGPHTRPLLPAEGLKPVDGRHLWLVDKAAAEWKERKLTHPS
jgi:6-phosphogluconolactonase